MPYRYVLALAGLVVPALTFAQGLAPQAAVEEARAHLARNHARYGVAPADLADVVATDAYGDARSGLSYVYLRQRLDGIEVAGSEMTVALDRNGHVFHTAGRLVPRLSERAATRRPSLTAAAAVAAAAAHAGLAAPALAVEARAPGADERTTFVTPETALAPLTARLVFHADEGDGPVRLAWEVGPLEEGGPEPHAWMLRVDAQTGAELWRDDLVDHDDLGPALDAAREDLGPWLFREEAAVPAGRGARLAGAYRVYPIPQEGPNEGDRVLVADPEHVVASPFGWHDTDGAAGAEYTITRGNNVHAYLDTNDDDVPDPGTDVDGGASLVFDFPVDLTQPPSAYRPASITNLFFWNNVIHDIAYQYGFTEAAGNFQVNTYGRGGAGGDDVRAEGQDGGGTNNANFATPADGSRPRMQMYIYTLTNPHRDGDFSNMTIVHEYSHGISNRLTGGPNTTGCLSNGEQMGEGWGDWLAAMLTMEPTDTRTTHRPYGTYPRGLDPNGPGLRLAALNTDFAVNDYTYGRTRTMTAVHQVGFVWSTVIWEVAWELIDEFGFSPDVYDGNGTAGNQVALRLVIEGMKLQPCRPGFVSGRDGILAADVALYGGIHLDALWRGFARRGLGASADEGSTSTNADNVEAFDEPEAVPPAAVTDLDVVADGDFVHVAFTATGDDGATGTAETYDLRYSTAGPITTDADFDAATPASGEPAPQPAGTAEHFTIGGLAFSTAYHFALKVIDNSGNVSPLSNPDSATTLAPPVLAPLATASVAASVRFGGQATVPFVLSNTGPSTLAYSAALAEAAPPAAHAEAPAAARGGDARETRGAAPARGAGGPDAFGYRWIDSDEPGGPAYTWTDIRAQPGATALVLGDDAEANLALPFTFEFYGVPYTTIRLGANGAFFFGATSGDVSSGNAAIPTAAAPNALVAGFWDDLYPPAAGAELHHWFDAANGRFYLQWTNVPRYDDRNTPGTGNTFQIVLDAGGAVTYYYDDLNAPDLASATVGIEDHTGTDGLQVVFNGPYLHDGLAVRFAALWVDAVPASGTVAAGGTGAFDLVFDAAGLESGEHHATLTLATNDPANATVTVPITLTVGAVDAEAPAPAFEGTHLLSAVRPNPFAAGASFTLAVREAQDVRVLVFDALGRRVATLHDGELPAGAAQAFRVDGAGLSAGTYVLRVEGETFSETRRITLTR